MLFVKLKFKEIRLPFLLILLSSFINGCIHVEKYPASWEKIISSPQATECPPITNTYSNRGEKPNGTKVFLAVWLAPKMSMKTKEERATQFEMMDDLFNAQTVAIELSNNEILTVRATGEKIKHQWSYEKSKGQFECKAGMLSIPQGGNMSGDNVAAFGSGAKDLYITENHLVINSHGGTAGLVLLIPAAGYGSDWARFEINQK